MEAKRNEERKASELHNLPLYMSPTKKCYANEEWTQWNFIFLHYVFLVLAGLHSSVHSFPGWPHDKEKKPQPFHLDNISSKYSSR